MPGSLLFAIPPEVLMNKMTLKRLYPPNIRVAKALTAIQLISMHLFIWRPKTDEDSADPFFGPYISILPRDFGTHPLTWLVLSKLDKADELQTCLLNYLPPSVLATLHHLHSRFWADWNKVRIFLQRTPSLAVKGPSSSPEAHDAVMDFLWAWLNVNTRCIYYRLKHAKTDPENVTMCPIVDFANHTSGQAHMTLVPSNCEIRNAAPVNAIGDGLKFISGDTVKIEEDDDILLTYGLHSNKTLFVEYGFVNAFSENGPSPSGEVDVQDLVEKHVFTDMKFCELVKGLLVSKGYWGDWTLHTTTDSGEASWRLITALQLYHLVVTVGSADEDSIEPWRDVVAGNRYQVSDENELAWKKSVMYLCDKVVHRAEEYMAMECAQDDRWMYVRSLWREELFVARAVREVYM